MRTGPRGDLCPPVLPQASAAATDAVRAGLGRLPVSFVANQGRWDSRAAWVASGSEATAYFVTTAVNMVTPVTTSPSPWVEGTTDAVVITAYKDNQSLSAQVAFVIADRAGNQGSCM